MKPQHTICNGNDLATVLGELKARNCLVESLDTGVKTNAGYQVNFIERDVLAAPAGPHQFAGEDRSTRSGHASVTAMGSAPMNSAPVPVVAAEHAGNSIPTRLASLQSKLAKAGKLRRSKPAIREARLPHASD